MNVLLKTAQNFNPAYAKAVREVKPPCIEVTIRNSQVVSHLPCDRPKNECPLSLTPETCPCRKAIAQAVREELAHA